MKTLFVVRHAKSSWKEASLNDFDRPLNKRGKHDAPEMGKRLKRAQVKPDLIISSPAKRALDTAEIIAKEVGYPEGSIRKIDTIYEASLSDLIALIHALDDRYDTILLVGHNPGLTYLLNHLSGEHVQNLPTCGIYGLSFEVDSWKKIVRHSGRVVFADSPKRPLA